LEIEEDIFIIVGFQQKVRKTRDKAWHNRHIKHNIFQVRYLVLLYDRKFLRHLGEFKTQWLGSFIIHKVTKASVVQLVNLQGELHVGLENGGRLKLMYKENPLPFIPKG